MSLFLLGDSLGRAVRAVGRSKGVVDEQVGIGGQLLPKPKQPRLCQRGAEESGGGGGSAQREGGKGFVSDTHNERTTVFVLYCAGRSNVETNSLEKKNTTAIVHRSRPRHAQGDLALVSSQQHLKRQGRVRRSTHDDN